MLITDAREVKVRQDIANSGYNQTMPDKLYKQKIGALGSEASAVIDSGSESVNQEVTVEISEEAKRKLEEEQKKKEKQMSQAEIERLKEELERMKESADAEAEAFKELAKIIEIARRISRGDKVPAKDEKKLMEFDNDLYQACKAAAMLAENRKPKEYDSLFEDEEDAADDRARALSSEMESGTDTAEVSPDIAPAEETSIQETAP